ncbi:MAG: N-acetyltransferase family protein [bacterium]
MSEITFRETIYPSDVKYIQNILESAANFSSEEITIAISLAEERIIKGDKSGYYFLFAQHSGEIIGYTCFGPIPGTLRSFDLYWIAIHKRFCRFGIGKRLLSKTESLIAGMGGRRIYIETSSRSSYKAARQFYSYCEYKEEALLKNFYAPGDDKIIYHKEIQSDCC